VLVFVFVLDIKKNKTNKKDNIKLYCLEARASAEKFPGKVRANGRNKTKK